MTGKLKFCPAVCTLQANRIRDGLMTVMKDVSALLQKKNIFPLLGLFAISIICYGALLRTDYLGFDDIIRAYSHRLLDEGVHGRFLADLFVRFFYGGLHTDASPFTQIVSLFFFCLTAGILFFTLNGRFPCKPVHVLLLLPFVVSPYVFALLFFRFDSLWMGLSAFFATLPFLVRNKRSVTFVITGATSLWICLCIYQPLHNLYLVTAAFSCIVTLSSRSRLSAFGKELVLFVPWIASLLLYIPVYVVARGAMLQSESALKGTREYTLASSQLPGSVSSILNTVFHNSKTYLKLLYNDWVWTPFFYVVGSFSMLLFTILIFRLIRGVRTTHAPRWYMSLKIMIFMAAIGIIALAPYGIQLGLSNPNWVARTFIGVAAGIACINILLFRFVGKNPFFKVLFLSVIGYFCVWNVIFVSTCGNNMTAQNAFVRHYENLLIEDMYILKTKYNIEQLLCNDGMGIVPSAYAFHKKYPFIRRCFDGIGDHSGWLFYGALRYAGIHFPHPYTGESFDIDAVRKNNEVLSKKSGYTIYRLNATSCLVDFHALPGWENRDAWLKGYDVIPGSADH